MELTDSSTQHKFCGDCGAQINSLTDKAQRQVLDPGTNYEMLETATDAEPKLEAATDVESEPIDKSFKVTDPLQWFKWTFPCILFTTLMIFETVDQISDCLQLQEVVEKFSKYSAPPFVEAGTMDRAYTVLWERVDIVGTNKSMLGYSLAWEGKSIWRKEQCDRYSRT